MENKKVYVVICETTYSSGNHDYYTIGIFDSLDLAKERVTSLGVRRVYGRVGNTGTLCNNTIFSMSDDFINNMPRCIASVITINETTLNPSVDELNDCKNWL